MTQITVPRAQATTTIAGPAVYREIRTSVPEGTTAGSVIELPVPVAAGSRLSAATARVKLPPDFPAGSTSLPGGKPGHLITVRGENSADESERLGGGLGVTHSEDTRPMFHSHIPQSHHDSVVCFCASNGW
jgi:hypothetical protein